MRNRLVSPVVAEAESECIAIEVCAQRFQFRSGHSDRYRRDERPELARGLRREEPRTIGEFARVELHNHPLCHVHRVRVDASRRTGIAAHVGLDNLQTSVDLRVCGRDVSIPRKITRHGTLRHADAFDDPRPDEVFP